MKKRVYQGSSGKVYPHTVIDKIYDEKVNREYTAVFLENDFKMGIRGEGTCTAKVNDGFFEAFKANGGTHMFAGHNHNNNFITELDGVTMGYMTKSSYNCYFTFDALGGTVLTLDKDNNVNIEIEEF